MFNLSEFRSSMNLCMLGFLLAGPDTDQDWQNIQIRTKRMLVLVWAQFQVVDSQFYLLRRHGPITYCLPKKKYMKFKQLQHSIPVLYLDHKEISKMHRKDPPPPPQKKSSVVLRLPQNNNRIFILLRYSFFWKPPKKFKKKRHSKLWNLIYI